MKKLLLLLLALFMLVPLIQGAGIDITASANEDLILMCFNSTTFTGIVATINCTDTASNVDLATQTMDSLGSAAFNITVNLPADTYSCQVDCNDSTGLTYPYYIYSRTLPLVVGDNIGINWGDVSNPTTSVDLSATDIKLADTCTDVTNAVTTTTTSRVGLIGDAVNTSTIGTAAIDADSIAANAIGASELAAGAITTSELATGAIDADAIAANAIGASELAADAVAEINDSVSNSGLRTLTALDEDDTTIDLDGTTVGALTTKTGFNLTDNTIGLVTLTTLASTCTDVTNDVGIDAGAVDDIWDEAISGHVGAGTVGLNLSAKAEAIAAAPSAATVADAVWDEILSGHTDAGSASANLTAKQEATAVLSAATVWQYVNRNITVFDEDFMTIDLDGTTVGDVTADVGITNSSALVTATGFSTLTTSDNIGINWGDVANQGTSVDLSATAISLADTCTELTNQADLNSTEFTTLTNNQDTIAGYVDTEIAETLQLLKGNESLWVTATGFSTHSAADVDNLISDEEIIGSLDGNATLWLTASGFATSAQGTELIAAHDGNLSSILGDTSELQGNQNWNVWDDGTRTLTVADWVTDSDITTQNSLLEGAIDQNQSETETRGDLAWITAVGFSTHNPTEVVNTSVECTTFASDSIGCIVWALERYG